MAKQSKFKNGAKSFFGSIWDDFKSLFTKHWLRLIGYTISFVIPLVFLIATYIKQKPQSWTLPIFAWLPIILLLIVYWAKLRGFLLKRIGQMEIENSLQKGKHSGALILASIMQVVMTTAPFILCYYVFDALEKAMMSVKDLFMMLAILEAVGGIFIILDVAINSLDLSDSNNETQNNEQNINKE